MPKGYTHAKHKGYTLAMPQDYPYTATRVYSANHPRVYSSTAATLFTSWIFIDTTDSGTTQYIQSLSRVYPRTSKKLSRV